MSLHVMVSIPTQTLVSAACAALCVCKFYDLYVYDAIHPLPLRASVHSMILQEHGWQNPKWDHRKGRILNPRVAEDSSPSRSFTFSTHPPTPFNPGVFCTYPLFVSHVHLIRSFSFFFC